jgi:hypothetical protein
VKTVEYSKCHSRVLTLLSGSENNSISNIKLKIPVHTDLTFITSKS